MRYVYKTAGALTDYLVVGSDSGKIVILEWNAAANTWKRLHEETFGRKDCRRIVPGQYCAVDPKVVEVRTKVMVAFL